MGVGGSGGSICNLMLQPAGLHTTLADVSCFGHTVLCVHPNQPVDDGKLRETLSFWTVAME